MTAIPLSIKLSVDGAGQVKGEIAQTSKSLESLSGQASAAAAGTNRLAEAIKKIGHYGTTHLAGSQLLNYAKSLVGIADGYSNMNSRLKLATSSQVEYNVAHEQLFSIAQKTAAPLSETIALYARMAPGLKQLGANQAQLLAITDLVGQSLALSGASGAEAGASMTFQSAPGFGAGRCLTRALMRCKWAWFQSAPGFGAGRCSFSLSTFSIGIKFQSAPGFGAGRCCWCVWPC